MRFVTATGTVAYLALALAAPALGAEALQTDWSGGGGVAGPVADWGTLFASAQGIDWASPPGGLTLLAAMPTAHTVTSTFGEPACIDYGDLDGDQDPDIVGAAYQGNQVAWWANDGTGGGWVEHTIATDFPTAASVHVADINGDGYLDVAATSEDSSTITWWENDGSGGGWIAHVVDASVNGPFSVCSADFDGDLDVDLCGAVFYAGDILWWENTDGIGTTWVEHTVDAAFSYAWWAVAARIDGDDDIDIVGAAYGAGDICWYENMGTGATWTKHFICASFPQALSCRAADMDGDTDLDVVGASYAGRVAWWENDGAGGTWTEHAVGASLAAPFSSRVADLDGDADNDVISNERDGDRVMWYENVDALGRVWLRHEVDGTSAGPNDVLAVDVDGDQALEVLASFSWDNSILWYEPSSAYVASGSLESSILDCGDPVGNWGSISWASATPPETSVGVEVRASGDAANMGAWSAVVASGDDLSSYVADGTRYFQYRLLLATTEVLASPTVEELHIAWATSSGIGEVDLTPGAIPSCATVFNPSLAGDVAFHFTLPSRCEVALDLYDVSGRKLKTVAQGAYPIGTHTATTKGLLAGVYLYELRAGAFRSGGKIVVR